LTGLAVVAAEIVAFVGLGNLIGVPLTLLLVFAASLAGVLLVRREGLRAWRGFREAVAAGAPPGPHVTNGMVGLSGALLLAAPGLVSGVAGAALLIPPVRRVVRGRVQARAERRMSSAQAGEVFGPRRVRVVRHPDPGHQDPEQAGAEVVEGEVVEPEPGIDPQHGGGAGGGPGA
jgi:UPF0716 protein FxsA